MAVTFKTFTSKDQDVNQVQRNVAEAVQALSAQPVASVGVLPVNSNTKLVGNEDYVIVDASTAVADISIVLPNPKNLRKAVTVKVTKAGQVNVVIKAVDIAASNSPTIDGAASVTVPAKTTGVVAIASNGTQFYKVN